MNLRPSTWLAVLCLGAPSQDVGGRGWDDGPSGSAEGVVSSEHGRGSAGLRGARGPVRAREPGAPPAGPCVVVAWRPPRRSPAGSGLFFILCTGRVCSSARRVRSSAQASARRLLAANPALPPELTGHPARWTDMELQAARGGAQMDDRCGRRLPRVRGGPRWAEPPATLGARQQPCHARPPGLRAVHGVPPAPPPPRGRQRGRERQAGAVHVHKCPQRAPAAR